MHQHRSYLARRAGTPPDHCNIDTCSLDLSIYGYQPSLAANAFFAAFFALAALCQLAFGLRWKSWSYLAAMLIGCVMETGGYFGRILLAKDPFSDIGFQIQVVLLTIAPAFISAGIYLILKHLVIVLDQSLSRIKPELYTWIFIVCDALSILLQSAGGSMAAQGTNLNIGLPLMISGLSFQVFTLLVFALLAIDYGLRLRKSTVRRGNHIDGLLHSTHFRCFIWAMSIAFFAILIRCIYRVVEMAGGFENEIMKVEAALIVLDSIMCVVVLLMMTACHPGFLFQLSMEARKAGNSALKV